MNKKKILIGAAGTGTAFAAACSIRRNWGHSVDIITMDTNPKHLVTSSILSDHYIQVPLFSSEGYKEKIQQIIEDYQIDTYLPLMPAEIVIISQLKEDEIISDEVQILAPSINTSKICADKWALCLHMKKHGIPFPMSMLEPPSETCENDYFIKPRDGCGSIGASKVSYSYMKANLKPTQHNLIIQEVCSGPEITVDSFFDSRISFIRSVCRERIETKSGVSTKCRVFENSELTNIANRISKSLDIRGSYCFQVMRNQDSWVVTDLNPRPGAATAISVATGNDFFAASFAYAWNESYQKFFNELETPMFVTRQYAEFIMG